MKNLLKRIPKKAFVAVATVAVIAGVVSSANAGFGPNRETRAWSNGLNGFDHVQFNSFTGVPGVGDERNFLQGVQVGRDGNWIDPVNSVTNGSEVEMKIYIHNNASNTLNESGVGVAKDVNVRVALPTGVAKSQQTTAYISASNAQPQQIWDTLDMTGVAGSSFELAYVPGSAKMFNHETGQTTTISDSLVTTGAKLPDQKGCFEYVREITFRVKVKIASYTLKKQVRFEGQTKDDWKDSVNAKAGQTLEWKLEFDNIGGTLLEDVAVLDQLPAGLTVVPGSVKLIDGNYPQGNPFGPDAVQSNGRQINVRIGNVNPGINSIVTFKTKVDANVVKCDTKTLLNTAYATPKSFGAIKDDARVVVSDDKDCKEPEAPSYICESLTVEKLGGRKVRATVKAPASNGATFKNLTLNWGDGSAAKVTDQLVNEYTYAADGTYKVSASVTFTVNGVDKTVTSDACAKMVTFEKGVEKCPIPGKEHLPKDSPECKETPVTPELPSTGAGSMISLFAVVTLIGAAVHNVLSRRVA